MLVKGLNGQNNSKKLTFENGSQPVPFGSARSTFYESQLFIKNFLPHKCTGEKNLDLKLVLTKHFFSFFIISFFTLQSLAQILSILTLIWLKTKTTKTWLRNLYFSLLRAALDLRSFHIPPPRPHHLSSQFHSKPAHQIPPTVPEHASSTASRKSSSCPVDCDSDDELIPKQRKGSFRKKMLFKGCLCYSVKSKK